MIKKTIPESKILTPDRNINQKKDEPEVSAIELGGALLKKNEFTMILIAALVVTALVFFFFFRGPSTQQTVEQKPVSDTETDQAAPGFESRISALEVSVAKLTSSSGQNENQASSQAVSDLGERITRIETAATLKLDTLIEHVDKLEGRLNKLAVVVSKPPPKTVVKPQPEVKKPALPASTTSLKKKVQVAKKKAEKPKAEKSKKTSQFHTVQKGETLWSISQKYKTNVTAIRKLNNLTPEDEIYPGSNLLVR